MRERGNQMEGVRQGEMEGILEKWGAIILMYRNFLKPRKEMRMTM